MVVMVAEAHQHIIKAMVAASYSHMVNRIITRQISILTEVMEVLHIHLLVMASSVISSSSTFLIPFDHTMVENEKLAKHKMLTNGLLREIAHESLYDY